jgi:YesN/AraC family two-component response regulator
MTSASSAREALDMLLQQPPGLLIADIGMPGKTAIHSSRKSAPCLLHLAVP